MKRKISYFIIKPDGVRYLEDICNTLEEKYDSVLYYAIEDYEEIIKKLYYKHYEKNGEKFAKSFDSYLYGLKNLFGNKGILVLVANKQNGYDELVESVYKTKLEIRSKHSNNNIGIVTNYGGEEKNYIKIVSPEGIEKSGRIMKGIGNYRISDVNIIHCPDPNKEDTFSELQILLQQGIIDDRNMITERMMKQMRKYKTANFQSDMKEAGYEGGIQPDISGFVKM